MVLGLTDYEFQLSDTGVTLNTDSLGIPFVDITRVTGLDSAPYRETIRDHEGMDGGFIDAEFETGRDILLEGVVYCDPANAEPFLDTLKANFAPVSLPVPFYLKSSGVVERVIFVKPRGVRYDWETAKGIGITNVQFSMYAEDPRFYDNNLVGTLITFGGSATTGFGFNPFYDRFGRTVSNGWGTSETGDVWTTSGGSASDFSVAPNIGTQALNSVNVGRFSAVPSVGPTFNVVGQVSIPTASPTGASQTQRVIGRYTDSSNFYAAVMTVTTAGVVQLSIVKRVAGVDTTLVGPTQVGTSHAANEIWYIHFNGWLTSLMAKAWKSTTSPVPATWTCEATDSSLTTGSNYALASRLETGNTDSLPQNISWRSFQANEGISFNLSFGVAVPAAGGTIIVTGNRPAPALMTLSGPLVNPKIINTTDGLTLSFIITLGASDTLTVDLANHTVTLNGTTNARSTLEEPNWWLFNPGNTDLLLGGTSGSGTLLVQIRNAWR